MVAPPIKLPVIGVFYNETEHLDGWLKSVELQRCDQIEPTPCVVVSHHPDYVQQLKAMLGEFVEAGRVQIENVAILSDNEGPTRSFNLAVKNFVLSRAPAPWIASLDPDARFAPTALTGMLDAGHSEEVGMISPIILQPRIDNEFQRAISSDEIVQQAGHFPFEPYKHKKLISNYWESHFRDCSVEQVKGFLQKHPESSPFTPCFCASLWRTKMFVDIGLPDPRQFRTLNCGEIGYRAQLAGWKGAFAPQAFAFHANASPSEYAVGQIQSKPKGSAWHFYHAQGLIALKYFPDNNLGVFAPQRDGHLVLWQDHFDDLCEVVTCSRFSNEQREGLFDRWKDFRFTL